MLLPFLFLQVDWVTWSTGSLTVETESGTWNSDGHHLQLDVQWMLLALGYTWPVSTAFRSFLILFKPAGGGNVKAMSLQ